MKLGSPAIQLLSQDEAVLRASIIPARIGVRPAFGFMAALETPSWDAYFPFPAGTDVKVDGPAWYDGNGRVEERSDRILRLRINLPKWGPAPELKAVLTIQYKGEGPGNSVVIARDGDVERRDDNATIRSSAEVPERAISSRDFACRIRSDGSRLAVLEILLESGSYVFKMSRT